MHGPHLYTVALVALTLAVAGINSVFGSPLHYSGRERNVSKGNS